jgi:membrane-bound lytic murein transglycosylase D
MKRIFFYIFLVMGAGVAKALPGKDSTFVIIKDDPISAMMDSLMRTKYFESINFTTDTQKLNVHKYASDYVPYFDDLIYEARMAKLDAKSPFKLDYNDAVRSYIDLYANRRRGIVSRMLGLSQVYFPMFEQELDKYDLPLELKYLAIVESALNPNAVSRSGATGLWQFMYGTGKMFGLNISSYTDDRRDPLKETEAACQYFLYLYKMFNDWQLVLAAYNGGPGTVNKAIRRSGGKKTYWEIRPFLPLETQGYVPAFIAVNYVMNYTVEHNLYPVSPKPYYFQTDTVHVKQEVSFAQISAVLNLPIEDVQYLNPTYKKGIIPFTGDDAVLCLPVAKVGSFLNNENTIYAYTGQEVDSLNTAINCFRPVQKFHKVKKGEQLASIAKKYGCTPAEIKEWNNLKGRNVSAGKMLVVYVKPSDESVLASAKIPKLQKAEAEEQTVVAADPSIVAADSANSAAGKPGQKKKEAKTAGGTRIIYHTVQAGDSLWVIANKYKGVTVADLKKWNNINNSKLRIGQKLKVSLPA